MLCDKEALIKRERERGRERERERQRVRERGAVGTVECSIVALRNLASSIGKYSKSYIRHSLEVGFGSFRLLHQA